MITVTVTKTGSDGKEWSTFEQIFEDLDEYALKEFLDRQKDKEPIPVAVSNLYS